MFCQEKHAGDVLYVHKQFVALQSCVCVSYGINNKMEF